MGRGRVSGGGFASRGCTAGRRPWLHGVQGVAQRGGCTKSGQRGGLDEVASRGSRVFNGRHRFWQQQGLSSVGGREERWWRHVLSEGGQGASSEEVEWSEGCG